MMADEPNHAPAQQTYIVVTADAARSAAKPCAGRLGEARAAHDAFRANGGTVQDDDESRLEFTAVSTIPGSNCRAPGESPSEQPSSATIASGPLPLAERPLRSRLTRRAAAIRTRSRCAPRR